MKPKVPLGKMLVDGGFIDEFQFKSALGHQRRYGGRLASQIYQLGFLPERTLMVMLARQQGFPAVVLRQSAFRVSNADALPKDLALRYLALPAHVERDRMVLVVANPADMKALDEIRFIAGKRVIPHLGLDTLLRDMITKLYEARAVGHETFVFGEDADTNVPEGGHVEVVTGATVVEPPRPDGDTVQLTPTAGRPEPVTTAPSPASGQALPTYPSMPAVQVAPQPASYAPPSQNDSGLRPRPERLGTAPNFPAPVTTPPGMQPSSATPTLPMTVPPPGPPAQAQAGLSPLTQPAFGGLGTAPGVLPPGAPQASTGAPLVLLIDGDGELVSRLCASLHERGLRTVTAPDGHVATQVLRTQTPDAVVLEANLQGVHGFELAQKLRASRRFLETPVVLLTSEFRGDGFRRDLRMLFGVDLVLEKPFPAQLLGRRLEELLVRSRRLEQRNDPAQQRAYAAFNQGLQLLTENRVDDAVGVLQRGLLEDPLSEHLHFQLGNAYRRKAMDLQAIVELERAVELRPDFYPALRNLASLYQERGFRRKSFELWERAMEYCPEEETRRKLAEHLLSYFR